MLLIVNGQKGVRYGILILQYLKVTQILMNSDNQQFIKIKKSNHYI